jgi:hypothetical protein
MLKTVKGLWGFIRSLFPSKGDDPGRAKRKRRSRDHGGEHYYLGDLLDNMANCFDAFGALKKNNNEVYELARHTGARVCNSDVMTSVAAEAMFRNRTRPFFAFIHTAFKDDGKTDWVAPTFLYLMKKNRPINVQPTNHECYLVGGAYHETKKDIHTIDEFYVSVDGAGNVTPLKVCTPVRHVVGKGRKAAEVTRMSWDYPRILKETVEVRAAKGKEVTLQEQAEIVFNYALNAYYSGTESGFTVRASKGSEAVAFSIDMERTPYFFNDREKVKNENGQTKKIFHIVRAHKRKGAGYVKSHFRGLRRFKWNGYSVLISMTGKHRPSLRDATFGAYDEADKTRPDVPMTSAEELAAKIADAVAA